MHMGFVNTDFIEILLKMVAEIYQDEFFMHVFDRSILQKSNNLVTSFQLLIRLLICKLFKSAEFP